MGFPGTTGATYIDYLVTDEVRKLFSSLCASFLPNSVQSIVRFNNLLLQFVSPTKFSHIYSETLVHLPHCYFVNDYKQVRILGSFFLRFMLKFRLEIRFLNTFDVIFSKADLVIFYQCFHLHIEKPRCTGSSLPIQAIRLWIARGQIYICLL